MNECMAVQTKFTEYLDGRLSGREMQSIAAHLDDCQECAGEWKSIQRTQSSLAALGPVPEPEDLLLRIRVAISHERARRHQSPFHAFNLAWRNTLGPFLLQAAGGFASAVLLMGSVILLVGMFTQPESAQASADEPLGNGDRAALPLSLQRSRRQPDRRRLRSGGGRGLCQWRGTGLRLPHRLRTDRRCDPLTGGELALVEPLRAGSPLWPAGSRPGGALLLRRLGARIAAFFASALEVRDARITSSLRAV